MRNYNAWKYINFDNVKFNESLQVFEILFVFVQIKIKIQPEYARICCNTISSNSVYYVNQVIVNTKCQHKNKYVSAHSFIEEQWMLWAYGRDSRSGTYRDRAVNANYGLVYGR